MSVFVILRYLQNIQFREKFDTIKISMGSSGSQAQADEFLPVSAFLNPGDPEIFNISPLSLTRDLEFSPKIQNDLNYSDVITAELLLDIYYYYKLLTKCKSELQLIHNIFIPTISRSLQNRNFEISLAQQLFSFENEKAHFFIDKYIQKLKQITIGIQEVKNIPPLPDSFQFKIVVSQDMINKICNFKMDHLAKMDITGATEKI